MLSTSLHNCHESIKVVGDPFSVSQDEKIFYYSAFLRAAVCRVKRKHHQHGALWPVSHPHFDSGTAALKPLKCH